MSEGESDKPDGRHARSSCAPAIAAATLLVICAGVSAAGVSTGTYRFTSGTRATAYDDDGKRIESCGPAAEALLRRFETLVIALGDPPSVNGEKRTFAGVDSSSSPSTEILRRPRDGHSDFIVEVHVRHDGEKAQGILSVGKFVNSGSHLACADAAILTGRYSAP